MVGLKLNNNIGKEVSWRIPPQPSLLYSLWMGYPAPYYESPYLIEHNNYGDRLLLFPNKEAAQEHIEGNQLRSWLLKAAEVTKINKYTVEQLRAAKEILEPSISTEE